MIESPEKHTPNLIQTPERYSPDLIETSERITPTQLGLRMIINKAKELCDFVKELDPDLERRFKVQENILEAVKCYEEDVKQDAKNLKQIFMEPENSKETFKEDFFKDSGRNSTEDLSKNPSQNSIQNLDLNTVQKFDYNSSLDDSSLDISSSSGFFIERSTNSKTSFPACSKTTCPVNSKNSFPTHSLNDSSLDISSSSGFFIERSTNSKTSFPDRSKNPFPVVNSKNSIPNHSKKSFPTHSKSSLPRGRTIWGRRDLVRTEI